MDVIGVRVRYAAEMTPSWNKVGLADQNTPNAVQKCLGGWQDGCGGSCIADKALLQPQAQDPQSIRPPKVSSAAEGSHAQSSLAGHAAIGALDWPVPVAQDRSLCTDAPQSWARKLSAWSEIKRRTILPAPPWLRGTMNDPQRHCICPPTFSLFLSPTPWLLSHAPIK